MGTGWDNVGMERKYEKIKKIMIVVLILILTSGVCFASGTTEKKPPVTTSDSEIIRDMNISSQNKGKTSYYEDSTLNLIMYGTDGSVGATGSFMWAFSGILDQVTKGICISLTPYPKAIQLFYPDIFSTRHVDEKYSNYKVSPDEVFLNRSDSIMDPAVAKNEYNVEIKSDVAQKATTNMLMIIIMSLFLAEVLFSVIYSYVTGGEEPVLKTLLAKAVTCLLIGALIMSLPFLVEAFKWGFDKAVKIISGAQNVADQNEKPRTTLAYMYMMAVESTPFEYPGLLLRLVTAETQRLDPENAGILKLFGDESKVMAAVSKVIVNMLFFIIKLIIFLVAIIASMHIMFNVIEVYILMSIALLLLPFQIFRLTSFMGNGVFRSLMSNVIQLAVISFIMIAVIPLTSSISTNIWSNIAVKEDSELEAAWEYTSLTTSILSADYHASSLYDLIQILGDRDGNDQLLNDINFDEEISLTDDGNDTKKYTLGAILQGTGYTMKVMYRNNPSYSETQNTSATQNESAEVPTKTIGNVSIIWYPTEKIDVSSMAALFEQKGKEINQAISQMFLKSMQQAFVDYMVNTKNYWYVETDGENSPFENATSLLKQKIAKEIAENTEYGMLPSNVKYKQTEVEKGETAWSLVFIYLATALCLAYMECFFIFRSSQITEGLLNGRDSGPDFGRVMAARAVGGVARAAGKVATAPVRGGAALATTGARLATSNVGQSLSNSGHTALGGMLIALSHVGSTQGYSATTIGNQKNTEANTTNRDSKNG